MKPLPSSLSGAMTGRSTLRTAVPVLPSLDVAATVAFYTTALGFACRHHATGEYAILRRDEIEIHFWYCDDPRLAENSACRVGVTGVESLREECAARRILRPDCAVRETPWGTREFEVFDPHGNVLTFYERSDAPPGPRDR